MRGGALLMDSQGQLYKTNTKSKYKIFWKCRSYAKEKCYAKATTEGFFVTNWSGMHNHPPPEKHPNMHTQLTYFSGSQ